MLSHLYINAQILRSRRVIYDGMRLIPVHDGTGLSDKWHLPGGDIVSTNDLIRRAESQDVNITIVE